MLLLKESVLSFEEKTTQPRFTYFQVAWKYWTLLGLTCKILILMISVYGY